MARYESKIKIVNALQENVYKRFADLSSLQAMKDNMSAEMKQQIKDKLNEQGQGKVTISNFLFDNDTARFKVNGMDACIRIVEREEPKCVKFSADNSPVPVTIWTTCVASREPMRETMDPNEGGIPSGAFT